VKENHQKISNTIDNKTSLLSVQNLKKISSTSMHHANAKSYNTFIGTASHY